MMQKMQMTRTRPGMQRGGMRSRTRSRQPMVLSMMSVSMMVMSHDTARRLRGWMQRRAIGYEMQKARSEDEHTGNGDWNGKIVSTRVTELDHERQNVMLIGDACCSIRRFHLIFPSGVLSEQTLPSPICRVADIPSPMASSRFQCAHRPASNPNRSIIVALGYLPRSFRYCSRSSASMLLRWVTRVSACACDRLYTDPTTNVTYSGM